MSDRTVTIGENQRVIDRIVDVCPNCGGSIIVGSGGFLTCAAIGCDEPVVGRSIKRLKDNVVALSGQISRAEIDCRDLREKIRELQDRAEFTKRTHQAELATAKQLYLDHCRRLREQPVTVVNLQGEALGGIIRRATPFIGEASAKVGE